MIMKSPSLVDLPNARPGLLEQEVTKFQHRLAETGLFTDENLIRVMDSHPREFCNVSRMGESSEEYEWGEGDTTGLTGEDLLTAVRKGRLWINVRRLERYQPELHAVIERLYGELEEKCAGFLTSKHSGNLLISSPNALVYYHLDVPKIFSGIFADINGSGFIRYRKMSSAMTFLKARLQGNGLKICLSI